MGLDYLLPLHQYSKSLVGRMRITDRLRSLASQRFVKSVGLLAGGTVIGNAILVLVLPILTRLYGPDAFGMLGVYMSLLDVLAVAACLRLDLATPLPTADEDGMSLLALGVISATGFSLLLAVTVYLMPTQIVSLLRQPGFEPFLWMLPAGVWLLAIYSAIQFWTIRKQRFALVAETQVVRAIGGGGSQIGFGVLGVSPFGLLMGHMIQSGLGSFSMARSLWRHDKNLIATITPTTLWRNLKEQRRFPLYSVPESLLNTAATGLPLVLIAAISGPIEAGYLLLAQRVSSVPSALLGSSISKVYLAEARPRMDEGQLGFFTRKIAKTLFRAGIGPFVLLAVSAPLLFPVIFGAGWVRAGAMVTWMTPFMILQFMVSPVSTILHATENQRIAFIMQLTGFVLIIGSIIMAGRLSPEWTFEAFALASASHYAIYLAVVWRISFNH